MTYKANKVNLEVFIKHWQDIVNSNTKDDDYTNAEAISKHLDIMTSLISSESNDNNSQLDGILNYCDKNSIFQTIFIRFNRENLKNNIREYGMFVQLKMYANILKCLPNRSLKRYQLFSPLLKLVKECSLVKNEPIRLLTIRVLYQLSVLVTRDSELFKFVKDMSYQDFQEQFIFVRLIILSIHHEKDIGRLSQEAMLLIFIYSKDKDSDLVDYICHRSDFAAILVSGLCDLFRSLPKTFEYLSDDWQQITPDFILSVPALKNSLQLLDFCSVILKMAHPKIQVEILDYLQTGFLSLVIGPSLHQNSQEENISTTAYLELFLRHLHHPSLTKLFLQFILKETRDNYVVLDTLISRLDCPTMLGVITLSLFRTILSFHCEDVMFHLILRYLIPCNHLLKQKWQHPELKSNPEDLSYCSMKRNRQGRIFEQLTNEKCVFNEDLSNSADEFLKLSFSSFSDNSIAAATTVSVNPSALISDNLKRLSLGSSFYSYLASSALCVNRRILATESWLLNYDGICPSPQIFNLIQYSTGSHSQKYPYSYHSKETDSVKNVDECLNLISDIDKTKDTFSNLSLRESESKIADRLPDLDQSFRDSEPYHSKVKELCDPTPLRNAIYKLNYFSFDEGSFDNGIEMVTANGDENELSVTDSNPKIDESNLDNIMFTIDENCTLADFLRSLDLLEECQVVDWNLDWMEVTELITDHSVSSSRNHRVRPSLTSVSSIESPVPEDLLLNSMTLKNEKIFHKRLESFDEYMHPAVSQISITLGPFLTALFEKLRSMHTNSVFINLLITGIIADLAAYPNPLMKNLILDIDTILHPFFIKLYDIILEIKDRLITQSQCIPNWESVLLNAYEYLYSRIEKTPETSTRKVSLPSPIKTKESQSRKMSFVFFPATKKTDDGPQYRFPIHNSGNSKKKRYTEFDSQNIRNLAYGWVIFDEFCKELASLCQEHTQHCFF